MAKLHIIYDPQEKIVHNPEMDRACDLSVAILTTHNDLHESELKTVAAELAEALLKQVIRK